MAVVLDAGSHALRCGWASIDAIAEKDYKLTTSRYKTCVAEAVPDENPTEETWAVGCMITAEFEILRDGMGVMPAIASRERVTDALLDRMVQAIVDEVDPEQVILFGSRGRGDEREDSDVDLIVVEAEPFGPDRSRRKEMVRLHHALAGFYVSTDILVYSYEDIAYWRDSVNHVLARALREGRVLYERR